MFSLQTKPVCPSCHCHIEVSEIRILIGYIKTTDRTCSTLNKNIQIISPLDLTLWQQWFFFLIYKCCNMKHRLIPLQSQRVFGSGSTRQGQIYLRDGHFKDCGNCEHYCFFLRVSRRRGSRVMGCWEASVAEFSLKKKKKKENDAFPGDIVPYLQDHMLITAAWPINHRYSELKGNRAANAKP